MVIAILGNEAAIYSHEDIAISRFEEILEAMLLEFQGMVDVDWSSLPKDKLQDYFASKRQANKALVRFVVNNLEGLDNGVGLEYLVSQRAYEWLNACISERKFLEYANQRFGLHLRRLDIEIGDVAGPLKSELYFNWGGEGFVSYGSDQGHPARLYHGTTSLVLQSILDRGILPPVELERRGIEDISGSGGGESMNEVSVVPWFSNWGVRSSRRTFRGYPICIGIWDGILEYAVENSSFYSRPNSEKGVRIVPVELLTHIYAPTRKMAEVRELVVAMGISTVNVIDMVQKDDPINMVVNHESYQLQLEREMPLERRLNRLVQILNYGHPERIDPLGDEVDYMVRTRSHDGEFVGLYDSFLFSGRYETPASAANAAIRSFGASRGFIVPKIRQSFPIKEELSASQMHELEKHPYRFRHDNLYDYTLYGRCILP